MKICVTGGAGFIGSNHIMYLLDNYDDEVVCIDKLTYAGNMSTLEKVKDDKRFTFYKGDIADESFIDDVFNKEKFDYVINFAAESHVDRSIEDSQIFLKTNILGVGVLLNACRKYGVKRFHQVSTDEVYGDLPLDRPDLLFKETDSLKPSSPYSASKASADFIVQAFHRTYGLDVTISRCSNNYGEYQFPEKLIPVIIGNALEDKNIPVYGNGLNIRDWLYVGDHCSAIDLIVRNAKPGSIYNIGGNNEKTNLQVVKRILDIMNKPQSLITYVKDRPGHDLRYAIDASKLKNELGWKPRFEFENGIEYTVKWYLDNKSWWKEL